MELKRGDIVVYCYPKAPEWHGTLAVVDKWEPKYYPNGDGGEDCYPVYIAEFWHCAPGFPYRTAEGWGRDEPWLAEAWEKVGHIDLPEVPHG